MLFFCDNLLATTHHLNAIAVMYGKLYELCEQLKRTEIMNVYLNLEPENVLYVVLEFGYIWWVVRQCNLLVLIRIC